MESCTVINSDYKSGVNYINGIKVSFDSDIEKLKKIIMNAVLSHDLTENTVENTNIICKTGDKGVILEYNVRTPDTNTSFDVCSDIVERIVKEVQGEDDIELI